jgi:hypothetical protein
VPIVSVDDAMRQPFFREAGANYGDVVYFVVLVPMIGVGAIHLPLKDLLNFARRLLS